MLPRWPWLLACSTLFVVHAGLVVSLFAGQDGATFRAVGACEESEPSNPNHDDHQTDASWFNRARRGWRGMIGDEPVTSGRHALHQYHGYLAATAWRDQGYHSCYDPAFQAGYPRTAVFDGGSRPAKWFALAAGSRFQPVAYKLGIAGCCLALPILFGIAAGLLHFGSLAALFATGIGILVCWSCPVQSCIQAGAIDLLVGIALGVVSLAGILRYDLHPGPLGWLAASLAFLALGYVQPLGLVAFLPFLFVYYCSVGTRHPWPWHLGLFLALAVPTALHAHELFAWWSYSWMLTPPAFTPTSNSFDSLVAAWLDVAWVGPSDRLLVVGLLGLALIGCGLFNHERHRAAARTFGLGTVALFFLAVAATLWPDGRRLTARGALPAALFLAIVPAAHALDAGRMWCQRRFGVRRVAFALTAVTLAFAVLAPILLTRGLAPEPLRLGPSAEQRQLLDLLRRHTDADARILWEERSHLDAESAWTSLLPLWLERAFLGGLDSEKRIEHAYARLHDHQLAGRSLADWSDDDLAVFFRKYNVGWIVAWNPATQARFRAYPGVIEQIPVHDRGAGTLFAIRKASYVLKGQARWLEATPRRITLADVVPEDGKVVLSLHYQAGMQASPGRVQVEREPDPFDPIPFVRLRMPAPAARITLTWEPPR
jgi:hypothetical protein